MTIQNLRTGSPVADVLSVIHGRRHRGALALRGPRPDRAELELLLAAAAAAPDHGKLVPFRFVVVPAAAREKLASALLTALARLEPAADAGRRAKAEAKVRQPPALVALIARVDPAHPKILASDQWQTVGAALQNLWLAAEGRGLGCGVSSGPLFERPELRGVFGLATGETIACLVAVGEAAEAMGPREKPALADLVTELAP